jgi:hypothetical protein
MFFQASCVITGNVPACESAETPSQGFQTIRDFKRIPIPGSLEHTVFDKVRNPLLLRAFVPCTDLDPDTER